MGGTNQARDTKEAQRVTAEFRGTGWSSYREGKPIRVTTPVVYFEITETDFSIVLAWFSAELAIKFKT